MKKRQTLFFVDAETDGLYGKFISIAVIVTDLNGVEIERRYWGISYSINEIQSSWSRKYVLPIMGQYEECDSEEDMLDRFWNFWMKYREHALAIADVAYPVEARLFARCVEQNLQEREFLAPFPLIDISSILLAYGQNPIVKRGSLVRMTDDEKQHNALDDVKITIEIWKKYWHNMTGEEEWMEIE